MHGSIMIYLFAVPFAFGLANYIVPLQIGAPDMAFPRLNALGYWLYLFGGITMISGFLTAGGAASFGWFAYAPLSGAVYSPGVGADLWIVGVVVTSTAGVLTAVNIVTTIFMLRAPGMTMFRMPIYTWNMLVTSVLVLLAFPVLTAALVMLFSDRHLDTHIFEATERRHADSLAAHVLVLRPSRGVHHRLAVLRGRHRGVPGVLAPAGVRLQEPGLRDARDRGPLRSACGRTTCSRPAWCCCRSSALMSMLIAVPTGIKFFNWIGTMWGGHLSLETPDALRHRHAARVPDRWAHRGAPGDGAGRLQPHRHLLRRRAHALRDHGRRDGRVRGHRTTGSRR